VIAGRTFGLIGSLKSYPRRAIAKEVARQGAEFQHRVTRRTTEVVFGRSLLDHLGAAKIKAVLSEHRKREKSLYSENGFLRVLGLVTSLDGANLPRQALIDQSRLRGETLDLLAIFDGFENHVEPFSFRDLILAKKYGELIASGTPWLNLAKSVHRSDQVSALTSLTLKAVKGGVVAKQGNGLMDLGGQSLFQFSDTDDDLERIFACAEQAEEEGQYEDAAELYGRCLAIDTLDTLAHFNRANCLAEAGRLKDAEEAYFRAIKLDPKFAEAWFNLSRLVSANGNVDAARRHLQKAIKLDGSYSDAVYNLAKLEFDSDNLSEAKRLWTRYLQLDSASEWAKRAAKGVQYVDLVMARDGRPVSR